MLPRPGSAPAGRITCPAAAANSNWLFEGHACYLLAGKKVSKGPHIVLQYTPPHTVQPVLGKESCQCHEYHHTYEWRAIRAVPHERTLMNAPKQQSYLIIQFETHDRHVLQSATHAFSHAAR